MQIATDLMADLTVERDRDLLQRTQSIREIVTVMGMKIGIVLKLIMASAVVYYRKIQ